MFRKKKTRKVAYEVTCPQDHVFEKVIPIIEGTEDEQSQIQTYCMECDDYVTVTVKGKLDPKDVIERMFEPRLKHRK